MKSLFASLLVCFMVLALALPASAAKPVITTVTEHVDDVFDCGTFQVLDSFDLTITRRTFFDAAENLLRREVHLSALGSITNLATGVSYRDQGAFNRLIDFRTGTVQQTGVTFHINVPGRGVVILEAGRFVVNGNTGEVFFQAGPATSTEQICAAMQ